MGPGHGWMKPKRRRVAGLKSCRLISHSNSFSALAMLIQCSLARGDLDNARSQLNRLENLLGEWQISQRLDL